MSCEDVARDLDAYVDRELDADTATAVRDHVSGCAACRRQVSELEALGRLVRSTPYYSAPDRLRARVSGRTTRLTHARQLLMWAAAAVLVVSAVVDPVPARASAASQRSWPERAATASTGRW